MTKEYCNNLLWALPFFWIYRILPFIWKYAGSISLILASLALCAQPGVLMAQTWRLSSWFYVCIYFSSPLFASKVIIGIGFEVSIEKNH